MRKMMSLAVICSLAAIPMIAGCDRTVSDKESTQVKDNGTTVDKDKTVKQKSDGTVVKQEKTDVNKP